MDALEVVGLGFGDEGKGTIVDYLARRHEAAAVVRYGGGHQATHHVVLPDGRWHGFSQFGAGTFAPGVASHLGRGMLVEPVSLLREDEVLRGKGIRDALARLTIDPEATLVLPYHKMIGQLAELARGRERHGSVGLGVGEAVRERAAGDAVRLIDARDPHALRLRLAAKIAERLADAEALAARAASDEAAERLAYFRGALDVERLVRILHGFVTGYAARLVPDEARFASLQSSGRPVIFEGAQGMLLDPAVGFPPFVTKTPATPSPTGTKRRRIGVLRGYAHRHGPGPLPSEDGTLALPEAHNVWNRWQGGFRVGWFDLVLARYAIAAAGVDAIALTCLDRLAATGDLRVITSYAAPSVEPWFEDAFVVVDRGGEPHITALRPDAARRGADVARVLAACRPSGELRFPGWTGALPRTFRELPAGLRAMVDLLASAAGLGIPVTLVSVGPTWRDKLEP